MFYLIYIYQEKNSKNTAENLASFYITNQPESILPYALAKKPKTEIVPFDDFFQAKKYVSKALSLDDKFDFLCEWDILPNCWYYRQSTQNT